LHQRVAPSSLPVDYFQIRRRRRRTYGDLFIHLGLVSLCLPVSPCQCVFANACLCRHQFIFSFLALTVCSIRSVPCQTVCLVWRPFSFLAPSSSSSMTPSCLHAMSPFSLCCVGPVSCLYLCL